MSSSSLSSDNCLVGALPEMIDSLDPIKVVVVNAISDERKQNDIACFDKHKDDSSNDLHMTRSTDALEHTLPPETELSESLEMQGNIPGDDRAVKKPRLDTNSLDRQIENAVLSCFGANDVGKEQFDANNDHINDQNKTHDLDITSGNESASTHQKNSSVLLTPTPSQVKDDEPANIPLKSDEATHVTLNDDADVALATETSVTQSPQNEQDNPITIAHPPLTPLSEPPNPLLSIPSTTGSNNTTEVVSKYVTLLPLPHRIPSLPKLSIDEKHELEVALQLLPHNHNSKPSSGDIGDPNSMECWRDDWSGNLALMQKEIPNPSLHTRHKHSQRRQNKPNQKTAATNTLWEWAQQESRAHQHQSSASSSSNYKANNNHALRLGLNLLALVYHQAPMAARRILGYACIEWEQNPEGFDVFELLKRCSYDPMVLRDDGWTTSPQVADSQVLTSQQRSVSNGFSDSASGGPKYIGKEIIWEGYDAVVIAYVLDSEIGDLWKAMWLDGFETFDLEAEELLKALKKWERKHKRVLDKKQQTTGNDTTLSASASATTSATNPRLASLKDFSVEGIEHGIILATTYNPNARPGVFWPARVLHVSELDKSQAQSKRNSAKQKVNVVFFAPFWANGNQPSIRGTIPLTEYPLFEIECIDVSEETIQKYPYDGRLGINLHQLRVAFRFTGLPKSSFSRFLDSHRMAMALKVYAQAHLKSSSSKPHHATAALFDTHALAINTARYPTALLNLPFQYILSKLPFPGKENAPGVDQDVLEPVLQLAFMIKAMEPPLCFGTEYDDITSPASHSKNGACAKTDSSAPGMESPRRDVLMSKDALILDSVAPDDVNIKGILSTYLEDELDKLASTHLSSASLLEDIGRLVLRANSVGRLILSKVESDVKKKNTLLKSLLQECLRMKSFGEDALAGDCSVLDYEKHRCKLMLIEWRKSCERLFKYVTLRCSNDGFGNGVTVVMSDVRCNQHITNEGCVERAIRLPTALKGAKLAGAGGVASFPIHYEVEDHYIKLATDNFLEKAHTVSYLKKMKARCLAISPKVNGAHLTEGSNGEGGCDTSKSQNVCSGIVKFCSQCESAGGRGTYDAAVAGVAVALKAVDMIVGGQCVNAFCATRPPGHHAGRDLHPMAAVSNGFCVLNPVACAAIYATTPPSEGGLGLKRAVVIDFDVHHGNGTQDILCSTYDPRFLYISMHAGGAQINGYETDDSDVDFSKGGNKKQEGIFPGRCGDTSPHKGVLNLPLGLKVTPHDVGNVLVSLVEPAVEAFSPDIIILSAGFDGHKNDPLGMGGLSAHDFFHVTEVACAMAFRYCSGRIMSVLEGGYGIPCCRPQKNLFLPPSQPPQEAQIPDCLTPAAPIASSQGNATSSIASEHPPPRVQPTKLMDLGDSLPEDMDDQVTPGLQRKLEKCHAEGFLDCVREHVSSLWKNNKLS